MAGTAIKLLDQAEAQGWPPARVDRLRGRLARAHPVMGAVWNAVQQLLALACRDAGIPCYALADPSKFVPSSWPIPDFTRHRLFEETPRPLLTAVLSPE